MMRRWCWRAGGVLAAAGTVVLAVGFTARPHRGAAGASAAAPTGPVAGATADVLAFDDAVARAATLPRLHSLLVAVDGRLLVERYFHGATAARPANIKSASKSVLATLVGIAIDRGQIGGVTETVGRYLPEYVRSAPAKAAITIEDLLTMRAGLESTSSRNYGRWVLSANWVKFALDRPMVDVPGGRMIYSTGSSHVLSAILTRATSTTTYDYARQVLADPLGIALPAWPRDPQGIYFGGNDMLMRPRDMVRVGALIAAGGRHADRQIVSSSWLATSMVPRTTSAWSGREYGYGWWLRESAGIPTWYAWGYGGQFIFILPSLRTVVVTTSLAEPGSERHEHLQAVYDVLDSLIVPAVVRSQQGCVGATPACAPGRS